jgi:phage terminase large subunit-like protein
MAESKHDKTWSEMGLFLISNPNLEIKKDLTNLLRTIQKFQNFSDHQSFSFIDQQTGPNLIILGVKIFF